MSRLTLLLPLLLSTAASAQTQSLEAPVETVGAFWIWSFGILFLGCCVAFGWMVWRNEKKG